MRANRKIEVAITGDASSLERAFGRGGRGAQTFSKRLNNIGRDMTAFGRKMTTHVTVPVVAAGALMVKSYADFEGKMTQSLAIMGDVDEKTRERMEKQARKMATEFGISHGEAAESYFFLASAGLDAEQSIAALPAVTAFAKAGMFDMSKATDLLTDAQSALGMASGDAAENLREMTRLSDVLVGANTIANASVEQFATALTSKAATAMRLNNIEVEEGVAVLALFADAGVKGEKAGTMFTRTIQGLAENAIKNAKAFEANNIRVFDSRGNMRDLTDITTDLSAAFAGLTDEQQNQLFSQLGFNKLAREGIGLLLGNEEALEGYTDKLFSFGGVTDEVAKKQLKALNEELKLLRNRLIDVGLDLAPIIIDEFLKPMMSLVERGATAFGRLSDDTKRFIVIGAGIAAAIGPAAIILGTLVTAVAALITPVGLIVAGIVAAIAAFGYFYATSETFRGAVNGAAAAVVDLVGKFQEHMPTIRQVAADVMGWLNTHIVPTVESIARNVGRVLNMLSGFWKGHGDTIKAIVGPVLRSILAIFTLWWGNLKSLLEIVFAVLRGDWDQAFESLKDIAKRTLNTVVTIVKNIGPLLLAAAKLLGNAVLNGIISGLSAIVRRVKGKLDENKDAISSAASEAFTAAIDIGKQVISGILNGLGGLYNAVKDKVKQSLRDAIDFVRNNLGSTVAQYTEKTIGIDISDGIIAGIEKRRAPLIAKLRGVVRQAVTEAAREARTNLMGLTSSLAGMLGRLYESISPAARELSDLRASIEARDEQRTRKRLDDAIAQTKERAQVESDFLRSIQSAEERAASSRSKAEQKLADDLIKARSRQARADAHAEFARAVEEIERDKNAEVISATQEKNQRLAELDEQRKQAVQDLADWEDELKVRGLERDIERQKQAYETDIANLTEAFNSGQISAEEFRDRLNALIGGQTGSELGLAFANEFARQLEAVTEQIKALVGISVGGVPGPSVVRPGAAGNREALKAWEKRRDAYHAQRVNFYKRRESDGGATVTAAEKRLINSEMSAWRKSNPKPKALADGGILRRAVLAGEAGPEAVLPLSSSHGRRMLAEALDAADELRGGDGNVVVHVTVNGNEFSAAEFARKLAPELRRQVSLIRSA